MTRLFLATLLLGSLAAVAPAQSEARKVELGPNANLGGQRLLPDDSPWHQDVSKSRVDSRSERILRRVGLDKTLHPDFGGTWEGVPLGIQYIVVPGSQERVPVKFTVPDESDPGPYPIPRNAPIEGGPNSKDDRHVIVLDRDNWKLYELFNAFPDGKGWRAESGAVWDLRKNQMRPPRWTSADAAGLPLLPGLVRYDEAVEKSTIEHAIRFTLRKTRRAYVPPASHWASRDNDEDLPPMGMRVRLKADFNMNGFAPEVKAILIALKKYGMILADNGGDLYLSGTHDARWDPDKMRQLKRVKARDLEVVEMKEIVTDRR